MNWREVLSWEVTPEISIKKMKSYVSEIVEYSPEKREIAQRLLDDLLDFEYAFEIEGSLSLEEAEKEYEELYTRYKKLKGGI